MIHYVLTRAAYPAAYPLEKNRRRLELTRHITARSLAAQTERRWRWMVAIDLADPLLEERRAVLATCGNPVIEVAIHQKHDPDEVVPDGRLEGDVDRPGGAWRRAIRAQGHGRILTTRLDDDDALASDALARLRSGLGSPSRPTAWVMPSGYKWHKGHVQPMTHLANMFASLDSPGELTTIMDVKHGRISLSYPVRYTDRSPSWLWVRHADTRSGSRNASHRLLDAVSHRFDIDWAYLRGVA